MPKARSSLHGLPLYDRPAHRVTYNAESCSTVELVAALIGGPGQIEIAQALVARYSNVDTLMSAPLAELVAVPGVGSRIAARLKAGLELGRRLYLQDYLDRPPVRSSEAAAALLRPLLAHHDRERVCLLLLDLNYRLLRPPLEIYAGTTSAVLVRPAEVFREAIRWNALAVIVGHGHPSGMAAGSNEDYTMTEQLARAGETVGIELLDHLVIARGGEWVSLKDWAVRVKAARHRPCTSRQPRTTH